MRYGLVQADGDYELRRRERSCLNRCDPCGGDVGVEYGAYPGGGASDSRTWLTEDVFAPTTAAEFLALRRL